MTVSRCNWRALFDENSKNVSSNIFSVLPGELAIFRAFGFLDKKDKPDNSVSDSPQSACLDMLLLTEDATIAIETCGNNLLDWSSNIGRVLASEQVRIGGCPVGLDKCTNLLFWQVPGAYRLLLNDPTAIGIVRIYYHITHKDEYPWDRLLYNV